MTPGSGGRTVEQWTVAAAVTHSLILAAGAGCVFYASIWPVTIPAGYFSELADYPWALAFLVLLAVWIVGPLALLVLGLVELLRHARCRWWFAAGWLSALAGGTVIGRAILHDFNLLMTAFPRDLDGSPLGPSRFAPGGPYWQALIAASSELAVCAIMITLIVALPRKAAPQDPRFPPARPRR